MTTHKDTGDWPALAQVWAGPENPGVRRVG